MSASTRPRPRIFRALGLREPPAIISIAGETFRLVETLKHDSWAATAVYQSETSDRKAVCKFNREQSVLLLPMRWSGRLLARREARFMAALADVPNVTRGCGPVTVDGRELPTAVAHWWIDGHPLGWYERVDDRFFARLDATIAELHRRGIAYVDLHKRENIIVAPDGAPWLIDYQICLSRPRGWRGRIWPVPQLFRVLERMDRYHLHKHQSRSRPDLLKPDQRDIDRLRPLPVRVIRAIAWPLRTARRNLLWLLGVRDRKKRAHSEVNPEVAFRDEST